MKYERLYPLIRHCKSARYEYLAARHALFETIAQLAADPATADDLRDADDLRFACEMDKIAELMDQIKV